MNRSRMLLKACFLVALVAAANNDDYTCAASPGGCAGKSEADSSTLLQSRARIEDEDGDGETGLSQAECVDHFPRQCAEMKKAMNGKCDEIIGNDCRKTCGLCEDGDDHGHGEEDGDRGRNEEDQETKTKVEAKPRPQAVTGMCAGNDNEPDVDCSNGASRELREDTENRGSTVTGTTPAECCGPAEHNLEFWAPFIPAGYAWADYANTAHNGVGTAKRENLAMFKQCTTATATTAGSCDNCNSDADCGWDRTSFRARQSGGLYFMLSAGDNHDKHVAEFWGDCAQDSKARWRVGTFVNNYQLADATDTAAFVNAVTNVYLAEEGGYMKGELQKKTHDPKNSHITEKWYGTDTFGLPIADKGSTRLYVVISARDPTKDVHLQLTVKIVGTQSAVADCMDNKMCLRAIDSSGPGSLLRNNNAEQLQCLTGTAPHPPNPLPPGACLLPPTPTIPTTPTPPCDLACECLKWRCCLTVPQAEGLLAMLEVAVVTQTSSALQTSSASTVNGTNGQASQPSQPPSAVSGECVNPTSDDPESWDCECHGAVYAACKRDDDVSGPHFGCIDDCPMKSDCIKDLMCDSPEVCPEWKVAKPCPCALLPASCQLSAAAALSCCQVPALLSTDNVSMQDHGHSLAERSTNGLEDTKHTDSGTSLDETLGDKCA